MNCYRTNSENDAKVLYKSEYISIRQCICNGNVIYYTPCSTQATQSFLLFGDGMKQVLLRAFWCEVLALVSLIPCSFGEVAVALMTLELVMVVFSGERFFHSVTVLNPAIPHWRSILNLALSSSMTSWRVARFPTDVECLRCEWVESPVSSRLPEACAVVCWRWRLQMQSRRTKAPKGHTQSCIYRPCCHRLHRWRFRGLSISRHGILCTLFRFPVWPWLPRLQVSPYHRV